MRKILAILATTVFVATAGSAIADDSDAVKAAKPPYKPGRQLDDDSVKSSRPPYKPGRQADDDTSAAANDDAGAGEETVRSSRPPYKPGRQADEVGASPESTKD
jgi:hypothetical protein